MNLSVVIPTWNEEAWLPRLLQNIRASSEGVDIIVADNNSTDATRSLAGAFGARIVRGGLPAAGRNSGARAAHGDTLLFLDADTVVPSETLSEAFEALEKQHVVGVHARIYPMTADQFIRACYRTMHWYFSALNRLGYPQGVGSFVLVRRAAFDSIGGFDESVAVGEDADFFRRLRHAGRIAYLDSPILVSPRRFRLEHAMVFAAKCVMWAVLRLFGRSFSVMGYQWKPYPVDLMKDEIPFCRADICLGREASD
jgi:GT2 family glycosyltransferase